VLSKIKSCVVDGGENMSGKIIPSNLGLSNELF
jgi:hypothetical protein